MYNELYTNDTPRSHNAFEINLQVRETERKMAALHTMNHDFAKASAGNVVRRTARRIAALVAGLF